MSFISMPVSGHLQPYADATACNAGKLTVLNKFYTRYKAEKIISFTQYQEFYRFLIVILINGLII